MDITGTWHIADENDKAVITRLVEDPRMKEVYEDMAQLGFSELEQCNYLSAAWGANQQFERYRKESKSIKRLGPKIEKRANELAELLDQVDSHAAFPRQVDSLRHLMWVANRGRPREQEITRQILFPPKESMVGPSTSYQWSKIPSLSECLRTLATHARNLQYSVPEHIEAAIASRKHAQMAEYIRCFAALLRNYQFVASVKLAELVSITAGVVLDTDPPDIHNTFKRLKNKQDS